MHFLPDVVMAPHSFECSAPWYGHSSPLRLWHGSPLEFFLGQPDLRMRGGEAEDRAVERGAKRDR